MHAWREHADGVSVDIEEIATGRRETLRGLYLAGCDGGHGIVRQQLGIGYVGEAPKAQAYLGGPMVSTYLRARGLPDVARTRCWQYWIVNAGIRANIVAVDGDTEFLFSTRLERPDQKPDPAMIASAFRTASGATFPSSSSPTAPGPPGSSSSPSASVRAASGWRETPCICSRRPAASA